MHICILSAYYLHIYRGPYGLSGTCSGNGYYTRPTLAGREATNTVTLGLYVDWREFGEQIQAYFQFDSNRLYDRYDTSFCVHTLTLSLSHVKSAAGFFVQPCFRDDLIDVAGEREQGSIIDSSLETAWKVFELAGLASR